MKEQASSMELLRLKNEKGQGLTEYVLILAFIAGIAIAMFDGNGSLKGTLVSTFNKTVNIIAGLFDENYGYVTASKTYSDYFGNWRKATLDDLGAISSEERLKADREGLALIGSFFLNKTQDEVHTLMAGDGDTPGFSNTYNNASSWILTNLDADRMGPGDDGWSQIMVPLSYWNANFDADFNAANGQGYNWLECSGNVNLIDKMAEVSDLQAGKSVINYSSRTGTRDRIFYSDGMIGSDSSNRAVTVQVHYNGDTVDQVRVQAVTGVLKQNKKVEGKYELSPGNSALNGKSTAVQGLDLTVSGTSENYKYKVNN